MAQMLCLFTNIWRVNWKELWEGTVDSSCCKKSSKQKSFLVCSIPHFSNGMHTRNLMTVVCNVLNMPYALWMQVPKCSRLMKKLCTWRSTQHFCLFEQSYVIIMEFFVDTLNVQMVRSISMQYCSSIFQSSHYRESHSWG